MLQKLSQNAMSQKNAENNIQKPAVSLFGGGGKNLSRFLFP